MERVNFFIEESTSCYVTFIVTKNNLVIAKVYDEKLNLKQTLTTHRQPGNVNTDIMVELYNMIYNSKNSYKDNGTFVFERSYIIEDDEWNFLGLNQ